MSEPEGAAAHRGETGDTGQAARRTFLVTGANTGIGRATAAGLARQGACLRRVPVAGKGRGRRWPGRASTNSDSIWYLPLDLADLDSVGPALSLLAQGEPLHVLVNNACGPGHGLTKQGFELMFGAITRPLRADERPARLPDRQRVARVVTVSSDSTTRRRDRLRGAALPERGVTGMHGYAVSSCATCCSARARPPDGEIRVTTYALHPGVVASDIWRQVPWPVRPLMMRRMLTVDQGAAIVAVLRDSPDVAGQREFYDRYAERAPARSPPRTGRGNCEAQRGVDGAALRRSCRADRLVGRRTCGQAGGRAGPACRAGWRRLACRRRQAGWRAGGLAGGLAAWRAGGGLAGWRVGGLQSHSHHPQRAAWIDAAFSGTPVSACWCRDQRTGHRRRSSPVYQPVLAPYAWLPSHVAGS